MAATKQQSAKSPNGTSRTRSSGAAPKRKPRARTTATRAGSASGNGASKAVKDTASSATSSAGSAVGVVGKVAKNVVVPVATAVGAAAAGVVIGRQTRKPRKVLGIKVPQVKVSGTKHDLAKSVGEAGKQLGKIAHEVRVAREKAEQVGKALN